MKTRTNFAFVFVLACFLVSEAVIAQASVTDYSCPGSNIIDHEPVLEKAALAELAYGPTQTTSKKLDIFQHCEGLSLTHGVRDVSVQQLPRRILATAEANLRARFDSSARGHIDIRPAKDGQVTYYVCDVTRSPRSRLAVAFKWMVWGGTMGLSYTVGFVAGGVFSGQQESVQAISLFDNNALGVPGTEPSRISDWVTSLNQLVGESCVFEFAGEVTSLVLDCIAPTGDCSIDIVDDAHELFLIGHSLGGAISQYVTHTSFRPNFQGRQRQTVSLKAYAFNSTGMPNPIAYQNHHNNIDSIVIANEILETILSNTTQIGRLYRYDSQSTGFNLLERVERHQIDTAQMEICECGSSARKYFQYRRAQPY